MRMMRQTTTIRAIICGLIVILAFSAIPVPQPASAAVCGSWSESRDTEEGRFAVSMFNPTTASTTNGCPATIKISNTTAVLGLLGGYSMVMEASGSRNMSVTWETFGKRYSKDLFLTQLFTSEADATIRNVAQDGSATIRAEVTIPSLALDVVLFILQSALEFVPVNCVVSLAQLFALAIDLIPEAIEVATFAANRQYTRVYSVLPSVTKKVLARAEASAADIVTGCAMDGVLWAFKVASGVGVVAKIVINYLAWIPRVIWHYFSYGGQSAQATVTFKPLALTPTPAPTPTPTPIPTPTPTPTPTPEPAPSLIGEVAYTPGSRGADVWLRDLITEAESQITSGREPWYSNVKFSPDGRYLMYLHWPIKEGDLYLYDFEQQRELLIPSIGNLTACAGFTADPETLSEKVIFAIA